MEGPAGMAFSVYIFVTSLSLVDNIYPFLQYSTS